jgi:hypothetical protein
MGLLSSAAVNVTVILYRNADGCAMNRRKRHTCSIRFAGRIFRSGDPEDFHSTCRVVQILHLLQTPLIFPLFFLSRRRLCFRLLVPSPLVLPSGLPQPTPLHLCDSLRSFGTSLHRYVIYRHLEYDAPTPSIHTCSFLNVSC